MVCILLRFFAVFVLILCLFAFRFWSLELWHPLFACLFANHPYLSLLSHLFLQVKHSKEKFIFTVETTGALHAKEVVKDALAQLNAKIFRLQEILPELVA